MSEDKPRKPAVLARPRRLRPSWLRRSAQWAVAFVGLCAVIVGSYALIVARRDRESSCLTASNKEPAIIVELCQVEFSHVHDPAVGDRLARALYRTQKLDAARQVAQQLLTTSRQSDGFQILGEIAEAEGREDEAIAALERARTLHRAEGDRDGLARDDGILASIRANRDEFEESLRLVDECLAQTPLRDAARLLYYCRVTAARTLDLLGFLSAAEQQLRLAEKLASSDAQYRDLKYRLASILQESASLVQRTDIRIERHKRAIGYFNRALEFNNRSPSSKRHWISNTELNLAYSHTESAQLEEAQRHLDTAALVDSEYAHSTEWIWAAAQLAFRRNDLPEASKLIDQYFDLSDANSTTDPSGRGERIEVATLRARIELAGGDLANAETWARRAVNEAEEVRSAQSGRELRPWVLAKRRAPYELLFTALARSGQIEAAAMIFDQWQGRTVQDALATPQLLYSLDLHSIAARFTELGPSLREISKTALAKNPDQTTVLRVMRDIDLLALIVADDEVWRLTAKHGPPRIVRVGSWSEDIEPLVEKFRAKASDIQQASTLGAMLLPDDAFSSSEVLHVVLDGRLGALPVAALRRGNAPLVAIRPIVRSLRLPEISCAGAGDAGSTTVLAYPADNLPNTLIEAVAVAGQLPPNRRVDVDATKDALFSVTKDSLLHIAAHGDVELGGGVIILKGGRKEGTVSAQEIWARRVAPSLTVLATCNAANADDVELAGSLASAFLAAGSKRVVATVQSVSDRGALQVMSRFYRHNPLANPARALAAAQAELAKTDNTDWPYFVAFGPDVCPQDTPNN